MARKTSECRLGGLWPDRKMSTRTLGLHCVDIESGESVNDSKSDSRVIWLARCAGRDARGAVTCRQLPGQWCHLED